MNSSNKRFRRSPRRFLRGWVGCALSILVTALHPSARAQYTTDFQTNIISGVTNNWGGNYYVGSNFVGDVLLIRNSAVLSDNSGYLGYTAAATGNSAAVTGGGSAWNNAADFFVGYDGSGNSLMISNAGVVSSGAWNLRTVTVGRGAVARNNLVVVTGSGSRWDINDVNMTIGDEGPGNRMEIRDGGAVVANSGTLMIGSTTIGSSWSASNNSVLVTGSGSIWRSRKANMYIGVDGAGNSLTITCGGLVSNRLGYVGMTTNSVNNTIQVTDPGSLWRNLWYLWLGYSGSGNSLTISNGAAVEVVPQDYECVVSIGDQLGADGNNLLVTGASSALDLKNRPGFGRIGQMLVGASGANNRLSILNGSVVSNDQAWVGYHPSASNNSVLVVGSGSIWASGGPLYVGNHGSGNSVVVSNSSAVYSDGGSVGNNGTASSNTVLVAGEGSIWKSTGNLYVGIAGAANRLVLNDSGAVTAPLLSVTFGNSLCARDGIMNIGSLTAAPEAATFSGACQLRTISAALDYGTNNFIMGDTAGKNMAWILSGGTNSVSAGQFVVGAVGGSSGHLVVNGADLFSSGIIYVGSNGVGNGTGSLVVSNGNLYVPGLVSGFDGSGTISNIGGAFLFTSTSPQVIASSPSSIVGIGAAVGFYGLADAPLDLTATAITNITWQGGLTRYRLSSSTNAMVGAYSFDTDNPSGLRTLELVGGTTLWQSSNLVIGAGGALLISNTVAALQTADSKLVITSGGQVVSTVGAGGFNTNSCDFTVVVDGTNTMWKSSGEFSVGYSGAGNRLVISNGGSLYDSSGYIGYDGSSSNNVGLVTGGGAVWSNRNSLYLGYNGSSNSLRVAEGGLVFATNVYVGYSGSGNSLTITNGGVVYDFNGYVGYNGSSSNNLALVAGSGSIWSNRSSLYVGYNGSSNSLVIAGNASVSARTEN